MEAQPGWIRTFHGSSFYALTGVNQWGALAGTDPGLHGILEIDGKQLVGVYTTPIFHTAVGYATPHRVFGTDRWFRVVLELCCRECDVKKVTRSKNNRQWIFPERSIRLHRMIILPNSPPNSNDPRYMDWDPSLEALLSWQYSPVPVGRILEPPPPPPAPKSTPTVPPIPIKCGICPSTNIVATATGWTCEECKFVQRDRVAPARVATSKSSQWQFVDSPMHTPRTTLAKGQSKG